jgi:hypothetical protein
MPSEQVLQILEVLRRTKETGRLEDTSDLDLEYLASLGVDTTSSDITLDRNLRFVLAIEAVNKGAQITSAVEQMTWKDFEGFIARILIENNYECTESYRRRGNLDIQGMEIDVIGVRGRKIVSVDAKLWGTRGGKSAALRTAAENQRDRSARLTQEMERLSAKMTGMKPGTYKVFPVLVTWLVEDVEIHEGVCVVPIFRFNSFVVDMDQYEDLMVSYSGVLGTG